MAKDDIENTKVISVEYAIQFRKSLGGWKKKDQAFFARLIENTDKIIQNPFLGKPLRYSYKNHRRIHIGSFVLVYEFHDGKLSFIDCDHHDKIYKKYK